MAVTQTIALSAAAIEYTYPLTITETTGKNITTATVKLCLGTFDLPGAWRTPDVLTRPTSSTALTQLLVGSAYLPVAGSYWLWYQVSDTPEVVPRRTTLEVKIT